MGDRGNVRLIVESDRPPLNLYTHWSGYRWHILLAEALKFGRNRWDDPQYLTRILITRMYRDIVDDETGGGIGFREVLGDGYPLYIVDIPEQKVSAVSEYHPEDVKQSWTFLEFIEADHKEHGYDDEDEEDDY